MKIIEKGTSAAAIVAALSTLACCVPLGFLGAVGLASLSVLAVQFRSWLVGAAILFLGVGVVQLYLRKSSCARRSRGTLIIFWIAVTVVILVLIFPQVIASVIAR